jgi:hypothetical protein
MKYAWDVNTHKTASTAARTMNRLTHQGSAAAAGPCDGVAFQATIEPTAARGGSDERAAGQSAR